MQAARNVAASRKTAHELHWVSLLLQFIDNALERSSGVHGHTRYRAGFRTDYPGAVLRSQIGLPAMVPVTSVMPIAPNVVPSVMYRVMPISMMCAVLVMPVTGFGR